MPRRAHDERSFGPPESGGAALALVLVMAAGGSLGMSVAARAQEAGGDGARPPESVGQPEAPAEPVAVPAEPRLRFTFQDAPASAVLNVFAEDTGLPVIKQVEVPGDWKITFISAEEFTLPEALRVLNTILQTRGLMLRQEEAFLYLQKMENMKAEAVPTFQNVVPDELTGDQVISLVIPLNNATANQVSQQLAPLVAGYGAIVPLASQNSIIITETAAQCRRIASIIRAVDERPAYEESVRVFPLQHVMAEEAVKTLNVLVQQRQQTIIIDQKGQRQVVDDQSTPGLKLQADARNNAIIGVGPEGRLQVVADIIALVDTPDGAGLGGPGQDLATFELRTITADQGKKTLEGLFSAMPKERRPQVIALNEVNKVSVVGSSRAIVQAAALLAEVDGGLGENEALEGRIESRAATIELAHVDANRALQAIKPLLTPRQAQVLRLAASPGGKAMVVVGSGADVDHVRTLLGVIDRPEGVQREVRLLSLDASTTRAAVERALQLHQSTRDPREPELEVIFNDGDATAAVLGQGAGINRFMKLLGETESVVRVQRESRTFTLSTARADDLSRRLRALAKPMLASDDGSAFAEPSIEPLPDLNSVMVRATTEQMGVLAELVETLDRPAPGDVRVSVVRLRVSDPERVLARARELFDLAQASLDPAQQHEVTATLDPTSGSVVVSGASAGVERFSNALGQAQQMLPPARTTRLIDVQFVDPAVLVERVKAMIEAMPAEDPGRTVEPPRLEAMASANAILVTGEDAQHALVRETVRRLDTLEPRDLPPLRLLQIRFADVNAVAQMLSRQYAQRPAVERREKPVEITADAATGTLIVSADESLFSEIQRFVDQINTRSDDAERKTEIFPLKLARAADLASAMNLLYPEPPIPVDRFGRPMPWMKEPREVNVSAEPASNALIVDAPAERMPAFKELVERLDRVELPPQAELRTYPVGRADLGAVSRTLNALARSGSLGGQAEGGRARVPIVIESEPRSNTLLVAGDATTHERVQEVLKDLAAVPIERQLRIVRIVNADPAEVSARASAIYAQQTAEVPEAQPVDVSVEEASSSLLIVAEDEAMARYLRILDQLQEQAGPPRELRIVELQHINADDAIAFLNGLMETTRPFAQTGAVDPVFEPVGQSNALLVAAQPSQHAIVRSLIQSIDVPEGAEAGPLRILRLRTAESSNIAQVLTQAYAARKPEERAAKPVSIRADGATNTLIVSAHPEMLSEIERVVSDLNAADSYDAEGREIRIFPLKVARAEELARTIDQMYPEPPIPVDARGRPMPWLRERREVVVRGDGQLNALIVDAPARRMAGFEQLVEQLDRAEAPAEMAIETFRLRRADTAAVSATLRRLADSGGIDLGPAANARSARVLVEAEARSRTIVVSAPPAAMEQVRRIIEDLDGEADLPATQMLFLSLTNARAERVLPVVERMLQAQLRTLTDGLPSEDAAELLQISADASTNALILTVPVELVDRARELVGQLDTAAVQAGRDIVRIVPLVFADAPATARALQTTLAGADLPSGLAGAQALRVTAAEGSAALVISGSQLDVEFVVSLIEELDRAPASQTVGVKTVYLMHGRAESVAPLVQELLQTDQLNEWMRYELRMRGRELDEAAPVRVVAEPRLNAIVITAPRELLTVAEEIVTQLDAERAVAVGEAVSVRVFRLINGDASEVHRTLEGVFNDDGESGVKPPVLRVDRGANAVVVRGNGAQLAEAERLIGELDRAAVGGAAQMRFVPLDRSRVEASLMAETVRRMLGSQGGVSVEVISAEELLRGKPAAESEEQTPSSWQRYDDRGELMTPFETDALGAPTEAELARRRLLLPRRQRMLLNFVQTVLAAPSDDAAPQPASDSDVTIAVDPETNALVLVGSPRATERVAELIRLLQEQIPPEPGRVRIVNLPEGADTNQVANLVNSTIRQIGQSSTSNPSGFTGRVAVIADPTGNALVVSANDTDFASLREVIAALAQPGRKVEMTVKVYALQTTSANAAADAINDFLSVNPRGRQAQRLRAGQPVSITVTSPDGSAQQVELEAGSVRATAGPDGRSVLVAGPAAAMEIVDRFVGLIDQSDASTGSVIREYTLKAAKAEQIAQTLQRTFDAARDARRTSQQLPQPRFVGDPRTNTLLVTATGPQHEEVARLLERLDVEHDLAQAQVKIVSLKHTKANDVYAIAEPLTWSLLDAAYSSARAAGRSAPEDFVNVQSDHRANTMIVTGKGESFETMLRVIEQLDQPRESGRPASVRVFPVKNADLATMQTVLTRVIGDETASQRWWLPADPSAFRVEIDLRSRALIAFGTDEDLDAAAALIEQFDSAQASDSLIVETIAVANIPADRAASSLLQFFRDRARLQGQRDVPVSVIGSREGGSVIVTGPATEMETAKRILADLDRTDLSGQRQMQLVPLAHADPDAVARTVGQVFSRQGLPIERQVQATAEPRIKALVLMAPADAINDVMQLIGMLDTPGQTDAVSLRTFTLNTGRAEEITRTLRETLQLDAQGRPRQGVDGLRFTDPKTNESFTVRATIASERRSNTVLVTADERSMGVVAELIAELDAQPEVSPVEYRSFQLAHATARDLSNRISTLLYRRNWGPGEPEPNLSISTEENSILVSATPAQLAEIAKLINELDVPLREERIRDFVNLQHAGADQVKRALDNFYGRWATDPQTPTARSVSIVADPATESLVIIAPESEWPGIRELLAKLDAPEYDSAKQLEVIALQHADARSVATSLQQAFDAPLRAQLERDRQRQEEERQRQRQFSQSDFYFGFSSGSLVDADELVTISAEPVTNSLIVSAGRKELDRIRAIVARLDIADFAKLPPPRILSVRSGKPSTLAASISRLYEVEGVRGTGGRSIRSIAIIGDDASGTLIVRAEESEFAQIKALADAMQQESAAALPGVRVLRVHNQPVARIAGAVQRSFAQSAAARNERFAVEIDRANNALVIACSEELFQQVRAVVEELDGGPNRGPNSGASDSSSPDGQALAEGDAAASPQESSDASVRALLPRGLPGQGMYLFDLTNLAPTDMVQTLTALGITRPTPADSPGIVAEPVALTALRARRSIAVLANPMDAEVVATLIKTLDEPPVASEQEVAIIHLKTTTAQQALNSLQQMLRAARTDAGTSLANALSEQIRRLRLRGQGIDDPDILVDLDQPIRMQANATMNALIVASTRSNVDAIRELASMLDRLPVGDAVTLRIFHLENASAARLRGVVQAMFQQGDALRQSPGSPVRGWPSTETGKALASNVVVSVDERTNALIIAGREEAVAMAEVLISRLDKADSTNWIEPRIVKLNHADAAQVAQTLDRVLVRGLQDTPESEALRRQVGRLRVLRENPGAVRQAQATEQGEPGIPTFDLQSRLFAPMSTLTIVAEEDLNALLVVGSPENIAIVQELATMLDVPAAARSGSVRVYPMEHAAADRIATIVERLFREQVRRDTLRDEDDVTIASDTRTNALIIATSPRSFSIIEQLLQTLDTPDAKTTVGLHVIPVVGNDAQQIAPKVQQLMRDRLQAMRQGGVSGREDVVSIQADAARNALIVAASEENLALIREVVTLLSSGEAGLDADPANPMGTTVELFPLRSARASEMVDLINELYVREANRTRGQGTLRIRADERLNSVVVTGPRSDIASIRDLIARLDSTSASSVSEIKIIELSSSNAVEMVGILQEVLAGRTLAGSRDTRQGSLLRFIRRATATQIEDKTGEAPSDTQITSAIREQVRLTPDVRTNNIVVTAPTEMMILIEAIIRDLESSATGSREIEVFALENADASNMAELLRDLFNLRQQGNLYVLMPSRPGSMASDGSDAEQAGRPGVDFGGTSLTLVPDERQQLAITVDARTNSLLVSATPQYLELVRSVVNRLDSQRGTERVQLTFELRNARVDEVAQALQAFIDQEQSRLQATLGPQSSGSLLRQLEREISVVGVPGSSRLILSASPRYIDKLSELIRELDTPPAQVQIQVLLAEVTLDSEDTWGIDFTLNPQGSRELTGTTRAAGSGVVTALGVPNLSVSTLDFDLLIRSLEVQGRLEVLSQPQILVNDNEQASINVGEEIQVVTSLVQLNDGQTRSNVESRQVGVIVNVTPSISPDGFVRMDIAPEISALTARTTQISENFEAPVISQRKADTTVTVRDGQTIIIGGLIQSEYETRKTKVPFLGDIPILGTPFRSSMTSRRKTELLIILQPRVIASDRVLGNQVSEEVTRNAIERMSLPKEVRESLLKDDPKGRWGLQNPGISDRLGVHEKAKQREEEEKRLRDEAERRRREEGW